MCCKWPWQDGRPEASSRNHAEKGDPRQGGLWNCLPLSAQQNRFISLLGSHNIIKWGEHPLCIHCLLGSELPEDIFFKSYRIFSPCPRLLKYHKHVQAVNDGPDLEGAGRRTKGPGKTYLNPQVSGRELSPPHPPSSFTLSASKYFLFTRKN